MNKHIKRLQKLLADGKITQEEYTEQLQELLDDKIVSQEEFDKSKNFEPESDDDKPIYSQADFDRSLVSKARKLVKKALTDAGVDLTGIENKDLLATFGTLALQGQKNGALSVDEKQLADLKKKATAFEQLQPQVKNLTIENEVLKAAGKFNPVNPKQVVRALDDYKELLEYDEDDVLVPSSVEKALKKLATAEPNLFTAVEGGTDNEDDLEDKQGGFTGKSPGGAGASGTKPAAKQEKLKSEALAMLGLGKQQ